MQLMTGLMTQRVQLARLNVDYDNAHHLLLRDVVIHSAVVLTHKSQEKFLQPFVRLMTNPLTMQVRLLVICAGVLKAPDNLGRCNYVYHTVQ